MIRYRVEDMTREQVLRRLVRMVNILAKDFTSDLNHRMFHLCYDWNSTHGRRDEIFMCEELDEDGTFKIYIEDDYWCV